MQNASPSAGPDTQKNVMKEIWSWIRELIVVFVVFLLIRTFLFSIITVEGASMLESLQNGDRLYVSMLTPRLQGYDLGDIVICYYPGRSDRCVKRVIGLPGETLEITRGVVYINGEALEEDYLEYTASYSHPPVTLADDEYFLLGDNRPISHDSHSADVGPVTRMAGKARFIIWPLSRFGRIK